MDELIANELITRKQTGGDCSQDESAWIKSYFDTHYPDTPEGDALATAYPLENDEWWDELEHGYRTDAITTARTELAEWLVD